MSFPVARPDRRLLTRNRREQSCVVQSGAQAPTPAKLLQLDALGARLKLMEPDAPTARDLRILLDGGVEVFGQATWRIGDTIGVNRARSRDLSAASPPLDGRSTQRPD